MTVTPTPFYFEFISTITESDLSPNSSFETPEGHFLNLPPFNIESAPTISVDSGFFFPL